MNLLCAIPLVSSFFAACTSAPPFAVGYIEGEYALVAPVETAQVSSLLVARGDRFEADQLLIALESRDAEIAIAEARAILVRAQSQLADLEHGQRLEEIRVVEASLASARAACRNQQ